MDAIIVMSQKIPGICLSSFCGGARVTLHERKHAHGTGLVAAFVRT